jgi:CRISP-associated protein Cas1
MIKRTLYFGNPGYLSTKLEQLVLDREEEDKVSMPIEDLGFVMLDHPRITITQQLLAKLMHNNTAVIVCDETHHPAGLFLPLEGHSLQQLRYECQVNASQPLKKQLWQQTIAAKIANQAAVLKRQREDPGPLKRWANSVKSGDPDNLEARAAVYYWKNVFPPFFEFSRQREGPPPNNLLNYGYAILRAVVARSLVSSGLLPTLGIFHKNQYNAYCLADDIMEPYRPYVDATVCDIIRMNGKFLDLGPPIKKTLLEIPVKDVMINGEKSPLLNAVAKTTASLAKCFEGSQRKILYPEFHEI